RVRKRNVDLLARVRATDSFATAVERPEVALGVRLVGDQEPAEPVRREIRCRRDGRGGLGRRSAAAGRWSATEATWLLAESGLLGTGAEARLWRRRAEAALLAVPFRARRSAAEAAGLPEARIETTLLRRGRAKAWGLLAVAVLLRVRV